ncbi:MAG: cobalt ECF transporter T component CbiQ [Desulfobacterales bacterium]|nr:cobalt ECF transporter T component CbiQ [Desulfobacterales bacterium]
MINEPFAAGTSIIHKLGPRYRIVIAVLYAFIVAVSYQFPVLILSLCISAIMAVCAQLNFRALVQRLLLVNVFILFFWIVLPLTGGGDIQFYVGPLPVYKNGILMSARITLKSNAILLSLISLIATMPFSVAGQALHALKVSDKIVHLLLISYRYIFVLEQEYRRLITAARIRGFKAGNNIHTLKTVAYLAGMLLVRAVRRAERVHQAMLCRGFKGKYYCLASFKPSYGNWIFTTFMAIIIICLAVMEWGNI